MALTRRPRTPQNEGIPANPTEPVQPTGLGDPRTLRRPNGACSGWGLHTPGNPTEPAGPQDPADLGGLSRQNGAQDSKPTAPEFLDVTQ
nr:sporozoite surface protein 2-like [Gorilla gorilla gorilla]